MLFFRRKEPILSRSPLCRILLIILSLVIVSGCKSVNQLSQDSPESDRSFINNLSERMAELTKRENALIARETAISARESELVTLFAELLKQKKQLENQCVQQQNQENAEKSTVKRRQNTKSGAQNKPSQANKPSNATKETNGTNHQRIILGGLEYVYLEPPGISLSARIDTGAQTSSLNALDMVEFERDGDPYIKFNIIDPDTQEKIELTRRLRGHTKIKKHDSESQRRPIVNLRVKLGDLDEQISFTLVDRSKFEQQVLIGRNFLRDLAVVDVSKKFTKPKPKIGSNTQSQ